MESNSAWLAWVAVLAPSAFAQTELQSWLGFGQSQPAEYGLHVRSVGDVDGDGRPDVAIGGNLDDYDAVTVDSGTVEIVSGSSGLRLHAFYGTAGQKLGAGVAPAGDLDGDGRADFAINSFAESRTRIHSGATGLVLLTVPTGATIFGPSAVDGGHDVDGDLLPDLLVGYPGGAPSGRVRIYSGATGAVLREWLNPVPELFSAFGESAVFLGDVDLDGHPDIAVGARGENGYSGVVRLLSSSSGAVLWSASGSANSNFGVSLARLGDVDRDGFEDLGVGANLAGGSAIGAAFVLSGATGAVLHTFNGTLVGGQFGKSIAGPGDLDSDGYADVVVGAPHGSGPLSLSHVHAFSGRTGSLLWDLPTTLQLDSFGAAVSAGGDLDGDGRLDVLIGAPRNALNPTCGTVGCVYFGRVSAHTGCDGCPIVEVFCPGDGSGTPCPCGNAGGAGRGCANSAVSSGAALRHVGNARVAADDFVLLADGMPPTTSAYFFQGDARENGGLGAPFGDGKRCASGALLRIGTRTASGGACAFPDATGGAPVSVRGQIPAGGGVTRTYQALYRNAATFCTSDAFNLTNGLSVLWVP